MSDPRPILTLMNGDPDDLAVVLFEKAWGSRPGKISAARESFGWDETTYYDRLAKAVRNPLAEQVEPVLVHRLRRMVEQRKRLREARRGAA